MREIQPGSNAGADAPPEPDPGPGFSGFLVPARAPQLPPLPATDLIGRKDDLQRLVTTIESRSTSLLTILGPGGVGKTRLALTAAWRLAGNFRDGAIFVPLSNTNASGIWDAVASTIGISRPVDALWADVLGNAFSSREMLLVLDDCEHVYAAFTDLPEILARCPNIVVLATSQNPLQLEIEQELWLQPLALPASKVDACEIASSDAVELFIARARRRNPSLIVDEENAADIAAIVRLLDGLPLAIELAAGQMRHFSAAELRHQLERSLPSLASSARELPERHRSLLNMASWSLGLLSPENRRRFLRLSVLATDFTPETAFRVMGVSDVQGWEILTDFADKSLVKRAVTTGASPSPATPRFFILQTLHAGARYLLQQDPEEEAKALLNHAAAYLSLAREAAQDWHGPRSLAAFQSLDLEHENFEAILESALSFPPLMEAVIELADPLFWYVLGRNRDGWVLPKLERILSTAPEGISDHARGVAHVTAAWFAIRQNHLHRAEWHVHEAARLIADPADPAALRGTRAEAYLLANLGHNDEAAIARLQEVITLAQSQPDTWYELSAAFVALGLNLYFTGDVAAARENLNHALAMARARRDDQSIAMNLLYLARVDRLEHRETRALGKVQVALPILEAGGDISNIMLGLDIAVMIIEELGDIDFARDLAAANQRFRSNWHIQRGPEEQNDIAATLHRLLKGGASEEPAGDPSSLTELMARVVSWTPPANPSKPSPPHSPLTNLLSERELEVLAMIADGKTAPEIAAQMFLSPHTVKRHMANIRAKLGVRSQAAAVAMLQRER